MSKERVRLLYEKQRSRGMQTFSQIVKEGNACVRSKESSMKQALSEEEEAPEQEKSTESRRHGAVRDSVYRREKREQEEAAKGSEKRKKSEIRNHESNIEVVCIKLNTGEL